MNSFLQAFRDTLHLLKDSLFDDKNQASQYNIFLRVKVPISQPLKQFPFLTSVQMISPSPQFVNCSVTQ